MGQPTEQQCNVIAQPTNATQLSRLKNGMNPHLPHEFA
jgi:hypothetical protein